MDAEEDRPRFPPPPFPGSTAGEDTKSAGLGVDMEETPPMAKTFTREAFITAVIDYRSGESPPAKKKCESTTSLASGGSLPEA